MSEHQLTLSGVASPLKVKKRSARSTHYLWEIGSPPPVLGAHSLAKHKVLSEYLKKYVAILAVRPEQEHLKLTLVDGFAGGGAYINAETSERVLGSPLIMVNAMAAAEAAARGIVESRVRMT